MSDSLLVRTMPPVNEDAWARVLYRIAHHGLSIRKACEIEYFKYETARDRLKRDPTLLQLAKAASARASATGQPLMSAARGPLLQQAGTAAPVIHVHTTGGAQRCADAAASAATPTGPPPPPPSASTSSVLPRVPALQGAASTAGSVPAPSASGDEAPAAVVGEHEAVDNSEGGGGGTGDSGHAVVVLDESVFDAVAEEVKRLAQQARAGMAKPGRRPALGHEHELLLAQVMREQLRNARSGVDWLLLQSFVHAVRV